MIHEDFLCIFWESIFYDIISMRSKKILLWIVYEKVYNNENAKNNPEPSQFKI